MIDTITDMLDREPFQPFRIMLTSGDRFEIVNPHLVAIGRSQITVYQPRSDRFAVLRLNQIAAVQTASEAG